MTTSAIVLGIITIVAIIVGPVAALYVQRKLDEGRETRNRKLWVFKTLMAHRATPLSPNFVQALNLIDVEFDGPSDNEKAVRNAWRVLLDHFADLGMPNLSPNAPEKTATLATNLLLAMGKCLGYDDFNEVQIKKGAYYPKGLGNVEEEQHALRRGLLELLAGKRRIPVGVFEEKFPEITLPQQEQAPAEQQVKKLGG